MYVDKWSGNGRGCVKNAEEFGAQKNRPLKTTTTRFFRHRQWLPYLRKFHVFAFSHSLGQEQTFQGF